MRLLSFLAAAFLLSACSTTYDTMTSSSNLPMPGRFSESDIAAIVTTIHQGEVAQGNAALGRASSTQARDFAQMLITDHTNGLNNAQTTFSRLNITPMANEQSRALQSGSQQTIAALNTYSGSAFDRAFIKAQVDGHQWVLDTLDNVLIPSAVSPEVKSLLQAQRSSVSKHLEHARTLLNTL